MQDQESYRQILGIEAPWHVERVELKLSQAEVHVCLGHEDKGEWACAEGGAPSPHCDDQAGLQWRHLDPVSAVMLRLRAGTAASLGCEW